jgi:hypothetical protein
MALTTGQRYAEALRVRSIVRSLRNVISDQALDGIETPSELADAIAAIQTAAAQAYTEVTAIVAARS